MEYLYKYYPIEEYALNNLYREEVCFNSMSAFDDDQEGKFNMASKERDPYNLGESLAGRISEDYSDFIRFKNRVLSLTKRHDMEYMWENYAGKGTGFCVEYRYQDLQDISTNIKLIEYCENKEPNAYFEDSIDDLEFKNQVIKILFRKEEKYKNECEVRLLYEIPQKDILLTDMGDYLNHKWEKTSEYEYTSDIITLNHYKCPKRILKKCIPNKIYLGPNIADDSEEKIREIISGRQYECVKITKEDLQ